MAAGLGDTRAVWNLTDSGADINAQNDSGETHLHLAARANNAAMARILLKFGANPELKTANNKTPLDYLQESVMHTASRELPETYNKKIISSQNNIHIYYRKYHIRLTWTPC